MINFELFSGRGFQLIYIKSERADQVRFCWPLRRESTGFFRFVWEETFTKVVQRTRVLVSVWPKVDLCCLFFSRLECCNSDRLVETHNGNGKPPFHNVSNCPGNGTKSILL